ncbi:MAG: hypothetical protein AAGB34_02360 [Planctomycetota bacterium]
MKTLILSIALACFVIQPATAQPSDAVNWCELANSRPLSNEARRELRTLLDTHLSALIDSEDPIEVDEARRALIEPLDCPAVSADFRRQYANDAKQGLLEVIGGDRTHNTSAALALAGAIATERSATDILDVALEKDSPAVRYAAARAYRRTLASMASDSVQQQRNAAVELAGELARSTIPEEDDPLVVSALLASLASMEGDFASHERGLAYLAEATTALSKRLRTQAQDAYTDPRWPRAMVLAFNELESELLDPAKEQRFSSNLKVDIAIAAGQGMAFVNSALAQMLPADDESPEATTALRDLAVSAETVAILADRSLNNSVNPRRLGNAFDDAITENGARAFFLASDSWIGASGKLLNAPYSAQANEFR